jgi:hypothetical protein
MSRVAIDARVPEAAARFCGPDAAVVRGAPGGSSVRGVVAHGDFVGALSPAHGDFEGLAIVFVSAEL